MVTTVDPTAPQPSLTFPDVRIGYDRSLAAFGLIGTFVVVGIFAATMNPLLWLFGLGLLIAGSGITLYRLCDREPKLVLDRDGITDYRTDGRTIAWQEIVDVSWERITRGASITEHVYLHLADGSRAKLKLTGLNTTIDAVCGHVLRGMQAAAGVRDCGERGDRGGF